MPQNTSLARSFLKGTNDPQADQDYRVATMAEAMRVAKARSDEMDNGNPIEDPDPDPYGYMQELEAYFGVNILDPFWKAQPDDFKWVKRLRARARKAAVAKLFLLGFRTPDIAEKVQISEAQVMADLALIEREWRNSYLADAEGIAIRDLERLDLYLTKLAPAIERGDVKAINSAVEIIRERGNIVGYRQGMQIDIEQYVREVAASNGFDPDQAVSIANRISVQFK